MTVEEDGRSISWNVASLNNLFLFFIIEFLSEFSAHLLSFGFSFQADGIAPIHGKSISKRFTCLMSLN